MPAPIDSPWAIGTTNGMRIPRVPQEEPVAKDTAAESMGLQLEWRGEGAEEQGIVTWSENDELAFRAGDVVVQVDPRYYRPAEVETLLGDPTLARETLGWSHRTSFRELVEEMVASDLRLARENALIDPWGNPYQYRSPGETEPYVIFSYGADGREGGEGDAADIGSL